MKELVVLGSVILVLYVLDGASGLKCFVGSQQGARTVDCAGSCYWFENEMHYKVMQCDAKTMKDECHTFPNKFKECWCNTDFCNRQALHDRGPIVRPNTIKQHNRDRILRPNMIELHNRDRIIRPNTIKQHNRAWIVRPNTNKLHNLGRIARPNTIKLRQERHP